MIIDTNVSLGPWPFRSTPWNTTAAIVAKLKAVKITQAWVGSCEAIFDKDLEGVNLRLVRECRQFDSEFLLPFGSVNPLSPDWREDVRRCHAVHGMRGIRLFPGYHGYKLNEPAAFDLLELAAASKLIVQVVVQMEDIRTQHPLMQVALVDMIPLGALIVKLPDLKIQILNSSGTIPEQVLVPLARSQQVFFDYAMIEGVGGVERFAENAGVPAVLFGSHFPLFYVESSLLKLQEGGFSEVDSDAIKSGNARMLLEK